MPTSGKPRVNAITIERYTPAPGAVDDPIALTSAETQYAFTSVIEKKHLYNQTHPFLKVRTSRPLWSLLDERCGGICPVGFSCLTLMHDGTVYPCRRLPISLGSIQKDGLFKIWYTSPTLWKLRQKRAIKVCGQCAKNKLCWGCRAAAYAASGDFMGKDSLCWKE